MILKGNPFRPVRVVLLLAAGLLMPVSRAGAATLSWSAEAPEVDGADIACLIGASKGRMNVNHGRDDGTYIADHRPAVCQTFTTGSYSDGYILRSVTLQHVQYISNLSHWSVDSALNGQFEVKVGTKDGVESFSSLVTEYAPLVSAGNTELDKAGDQIGTGTGWYLTLKLDHPLVLEPDTNYGFSISLLSEGYIEVNGNGTTRSNYQDGEAFGVQDNMVTDYKGDYVFHLDMSVNVIGQREAPANWSDDFVFFARGGGHEGVAFLMESPNGGVWVVSSGSMIQRLKGADVHEIISARGAKIPVPEHVMVARNSDLVLFKTDQPAGLPCAESCGFDEEILAFSWGLSYSESEMIDRLNKKKKSLLESCEEIDKILRGLGENEKYRWKWTPEELEKSLVSVMNQVAGINDAIYELKKDVQERSDAAAGGIALNRGVLFIGRALAIGADRIEVSTPISMYDSGGPVLNRNGEVVGVLSHLIDSSGLPGWITEGTRFEESRRFAVRLGSVEWTPMTLKEYLEE